MSTTEQNNQHAAGQTQAVVQQPFCKGDRVVCVSIGDDEGDNRWAHVFTLGKHYVVTTCEFDHDLQDWFVSIAEIGNEERQFEWVASRFNLVR